MVNRELTNTTFADQYLSKQRETTEERKGISYARLNVSEGLGEIELDRWETVGNKSTQQNIKQKTTNYINTSHVKGLDGNDITVPGLLDEIADMLVNNRRERSISERWERVAVGIRYRCTVNKCHNGHWYRDTPREFEKHLIQRHGLRGEVLRKKIEEGRIT